MQCRRHHENSETAPCSCAGKCAGMDDAQMRKLASELPARQAA
jgi:hypothetical protein